MTVGQMIEKLRQFDPDLPVCISDWNEQYRDPSEEAAEIVQSMSCSYWATNSLPDNRGIILPKVDRVVVIGNTSL